MQTYGVEVVRDFHNHKKPMFNEILIDTDTTPKLNNIIVEAEEGFPEWVSIYFTEVSGDREIMRCNLCEVEIDVAAKSSTLITHIRDSHKDIYDLHKDNPEATVGFRVEFLHMNVLKGDEGDGVERGQPVILGEVCETTEDEVTEVVNATVEPESDVINMQYVMMGTKRKPKTLTTSEQRKRSWIWKYFDRLSNIVYRCTVCNVVLSTKGSNTNNLNRHMRSKHPDTFKAERFGEAMAKVNLGQDVSSEVETPYAVKTEEIYACNDQSPKSRRSWIWSYFEYVSTTQAKCKLCHRHINHGGNATGNMNRHLKTIHHKTDTERNNQPDMSWVWKVFVREAGAVTCKICQHRLTWNSSEGDMAALTLHLKREHGVVSGDQIITGTECDLDEN